MLNIESLIPKIEELTGREIVSAEHIGKGFNNDVVLLIDDEEKKLVLKYNLSHDTQNPLKKVYYKLKWLRRAVLRAQAAFSLRGTTNAFIRKKYGSMNAPFLIQQMAHEIDSSVKVPYIINYGKFALEEYGGTPLTEEFTNTKTSKIYASQLAEFLTKFHSLLVLPVSKKPLYKSFIAHVPLAQNFYKNLISKKALQIFNESVQILSKMSSADELRTLTHFDIRKPNFVIEKETGKLTLVDWEFAGIRSAYADFISNGAYSRDIPYSFMNDVVDKYNEFSKIKINKLKLKHLFKVSLIDNFCKYSVTRLLPKEKFEELLNSEVMPLLDCIEKEFVVSSEPQI